MKKTESGRSLTELLGTLSIMGILAVIGLAAYRAGMNRHHANTLINEANRRAVIVAGQIGLNGGAPSLAEFESYNNTSAGTFGNVATSGLTGQFGVQVSKVKKKVCENILQSIGKSTPIRRLSKEGTPTTPITSCDEENAFLFIYNNDMTGDDKIEPPKSCRTVNDCATACATCEIPEDEEVGICTNECEDPVKLCKMDTDCNAQNECMVCDTNVGLCKNGCERVEYLESGQNTYINTGIFGKKSISTDIVYSLGNVYDSTINTGSYPRLFCGNNCAWDYKSYSIYMRMQGSYYTDNGMVGFHGTENLLIKEPSITDVYNTTIRADGSTTVSINSNSLSSSINASISNLNASKYFYLLYGDNAENNSPVHWRLRECKMHDGSTLVRDFVPVISPSKEPCLFDKVSKKLFYNSGTGTFKTNKN